GSNWRSGGGGSSRVEGFMLVRRRTSMRRRVAAIRSDLLAIADWSGRSRGARASCENVERTARRGSQFFNDVRIDHRRLDIRVPQILLNLPDIDAVEQQVRRE